MSEDRNEETKRRLERAGFDVQLAAPLIPLLASALQELPARNEDSEARPDPEALLRYEDAAKLLRMPKGTLMHWTIEGKVPHIRLGPKSVRFDRAALVAWARSHAKTGGAG